MPDAWRASSSNRKSASALVSSVLPTPVGPRNRKEPIGLLGSCRPAAGAPHRVGQRRQAPLPDPRRDWRRSLFHGRAAFPRSPSSILSDRDAGPAGDHRGDVPQRRPTSGLQPDPSARLGLGVSQLLLQRRDFAIGDLDARCRSPRRWAATSSARRLVDGFAHLGVRTRPCPSPPSSERSCPRTEPRGRPVRPRSFSSRCLGGGVAFPR